ncbi:hypothetical protein LPJ78_002575 [Coemansia sp. RSA 989]|nr:hypothetical protein LPJ78_002575 [Coemansia sp. RSA 989]
MSGVTLFSSAWEAQSEAHIYGYAIQALNPGLIKCAALGNRLSQNPHTSTEMLVVVDSSLVLFAINGPEMEMQRICDAPVFSKVLDIVFSGNSGDSDGVYIVLSSDGQLVLVDSEAIGDRRRLRVIERYSVLTQEEDGLAIRLLRKLVADPLARCVAAVSWIDFIEVSMLVWSTGQSRYPQIRNERIQISTGEAICDAAILMPSPTETQRILLLAAVMDGEKQSYFLHLYEIWTISTASHMAFSLVAKLPLPLDLATPLHIIPLPQFPEHFILITETEAGRLSPGDVMAYLESEHEQGFDYIFLSGNCAANTIMRITTDSNSTETDQFSPQTSDLNASAPIRWLYPVLGNQSPMLDFTLQSGTLYATNSRGQSGGILRAQFGHSARLLSETTASDDDIQETELVAPIWAFYVQSRHSNSKKTSCIVLQHANTNVPVLEAHGEWVVFEPLYRIISNQRLLFIGNIRSNMLLCVFRGCVGVVDLQSAELSLIPIMSAVDNQVFTHGACLASESRIWVALAIQPRSLSTSRTTLVRVASVTPSHTANISSEQWEFAEVFVEADVSCMRLFVIGASIVLAIGTYAPELRLYRLEAESTAVPKVTPIHFDMPLAFTQDSCEQMSDSMSIGSRAGPAVSDICILHEPSVSYVLVGLRDGHLSWKSLHTGCLTDTGDYTCVGAAISDPRVVKVGKVPVSFATDSVQFKSILPGAVVCSSSLYLAKIGELCQLNITPCQGPYTLYASIHCIAPLLAENAANSGPRSCANDDESIGARSQTQRFFATYTDGRVGTLEIDFFAECSISTYSVKAEPKRLVVDQNTGLLLVACKAPVSLDPEVSGWTSELKAVDPRTGWIHDKVQFRAMELVCSLATWNIRGPKTYRYLCVGTTQFAEDMRSTGGRLVIYSIKQTKRKSRTKRAGSSLELMGYELKYVWESDRRGPVSALASLGDSYLVVAVGSSCLVLKLDVVQKRLIECCECRLRFAATSLDVRGYDIVVGSQRESVNVLRFTPSVDPNGCDQLVLMHSARFGGHTVDARFIADDLVAGIDHNGFLYVVGIPKHSTEFALDYVLGMHLQTECTRMQVGRLIQKPSQPQHALSWSTGHSTSCLPDADHLVVSTLSGALWTLLRISEVAYEVLRKLEQTMLKMPVLHPAFPLVPSSEGLVNRAGKGSRIQPAGTIDGTYLTIFASQLTRDEQIEVVSSSPDLTRAALSLDPESNSASAAIARLLYTLNHTCIC